MVTGKMAKAKEKRKAKAKAKASEIQLLDALAMARSSCHPISTSDGGRLLIEETAFLLVRLIMSPRVASPKDAINPRGDGDPQSDWGMVGEVLSKRVVRLLSGECFQHKCCFLQCMRQSLISENDHHHHHHRRRRR